jgi:hypothetical protein
MSEMLEKEQKRRPFIYRQYLSSFVEVTVEARTEEEADELGKAAVDSMDEDEYNDQCLANSQCGGNEVLEDVQEDE